MHVGLIKLPLIKSYSCTILHAWEELWVYSNLSCISLWQTLHSTIRDPKNTWYLFFFLFNLNKLSVPQSEWEEMNKWHEISQSGFSELAPPCCYLNVVKGIFNFYFSFKLRCYSECYSGVTQNASMVVKRDK